MKVGKLLENVMKGKLEIDTKIKINNTKEIVYKYDNLLQKHYFEDESGKQIDIMDYLLCDFEPVVEKYDKDVWDEIDEQLNPTTSDNPNIRKTLGTSNEGSGKFPKFTMSMIRDYLSGNSDIARAENGNGFEFVLKNNNQGKYKFHEDGSLEYISFYEQALKDYSYEQNQSISFYYTAEGYYDAALAMIDDYQKRFEKVYDLGNLNKNTESFGYHQDSIIKTLLAFSCECYLKSLLLNLGKNLNDLKSLSHGLVDLYSALDSDTFAEVFLDMEKNGYDIAKYKSPNIPYDNPDLTEKFMIELGIVDDAFVDSRYCAEKDKNTNYEFLYRFAKSLKNISDNKIKVSSPFNDGTHIKR